MFSTFLKKFWLRFHTRDLTLLFDPYDYTFTNTKETDQTNNLRRAPYGDLAVCLDNNSQESSFTLFGSKKLIYDFG